MYLSPAGCTAVSLYYLGPQRVLMIVFGVLQEDFTEEDSSESMEEFQVILGELVGDQSSDRIRVELDKLLVALQTSRANEQRLMSKCRDLNAEILSASAKVAAALKLSQEDETTITSLKMVTSHIILGGLGSLCVTLMRGSFSLHIFIQLAPLCRNLISLVI